MNPKFALKVIQSGQTQKVHAITPGAGMAGQALVISASDLARYQISDIVTLESPKKLQLKRVGQQLHMALPGGDINAPDVVVDNYFSARNTSLWGQSGTGEWMTYDTSALADAGGGAGSSLGGDQALSSGSTQAVERSALVSLDTAPTSAMAFAETPMGLGAIGAGGLGLAALAGGGGGGGSSGSTSSSVTTDPETIIRNYATSTSNTAPTLAHYTSYGVKALASLSDTSDGSRVALSASNTNLSALNSAIAKLGAPNITLAKVQAAADAYFRILKEADGNTSADIDVYADVANDAGNAAAYEDPRAEDYSSIGATVGATGKALDLLNDIVGRSASTAVDTVDEINALARAAENVMLQAKAASSAASGGPALYTTDVEWVSGLALLGFTGLTSGMVADIKNAIAATDDGGLDVSSYSALNTVLTPILSAHLLRNYALSSSNTTPTLQNYKDAGVMVLSSLSETTASGDITGSTVLSAAILNSALDKLDLSGQTTATAIVTSVQSMANSYYRILMEADSVINTTTNVDVYPAATADDPSATDYANIGATVGNAKSVDLLNDYVGQSAKTAVDSVDEINAIARAAYNVMLQAGVAAGTGTLPAIYATDATSTADKKWVDGLTALGISGVTVSNIAAVKQAIASTATMGTANDGLEVDTVQEIKDLLKSAIAWQTLKDYANSTAGAGVTTPSLATYKDAGIKALLNLSETASNASADMDSASVLTLLSSASSTVSTFTLQTALNSALDKLNGNASSFATGNPNDVQTMVAAYFRILAEADGVVNTTTNTFVNGGGNLSNNDPTLVDYAAIGATVGNDGKSLDLLNDFVGQAQDAAVDSVTEIDAAARAAYNVMLQAGVSAGTGSLPAVYSTDAEWVSGLGALGVTGVSTSNVSAIKTVIAAAGGGSAVDTVAEVQALVSLARLKAFTDDTGLLTGSPLKTAATPTLADWSALGVKAYAGLGDASPSQTLSGANTNLAAINSALDRLASAGHLDAGVATATTELQSIASAYARVLAEADGTRATDFYVFSAGADTSDPAQADYATLLGGAANLTALTSGADAAWLTLLNDCIGGLNTTAVDTATEVEDLIKASVNVMQQAVGSGWNYTTDADWVGALTSLGVSGLSSMSNANLATVKSTITALASGTDIDTWAELQGIVSLIRINDYAASSTNSVPGFSDYQAFFTYGQSGHTDLTNSSIYVGAFNDAVNYKPGNAFTAAEVRALVDGYSAILAEANGSSADQQTYDPSAADYRAVGVGTGTAYDTAIDAMLGTTFNSLLTDVVAGKFQTDVDTVGELNTLALAVTKIEQLESKSTGDTNYTNVSGGALQVSELTSLGLNTANLTDSNLSATVLQHRLNNVYDSIIAASAPAAVDSLAELQALINNTSTIVA